MLHFLGFAVFDEGLDFWNVRKIFYWLIGLVLALCFIESLLCPVECAVACFALGFVLFSVLFIDVVFPDVVFADEL